jgi:hypothetical protein
MARKKRLTKEEIAKREAEIVQLKRARVSFAEIGRRYDISDVMAGKIYRAALAKNPLTTMQVDELRLEETDLSDTATRALLQLAMSNETDQQGRPVVSPRTKVEAWNSIRSWSDHKAKLNGLFAPTTFQVSTITELDAEIMKLEAQLDARSKMGVNGDSAASPPWGAAASEAAPPA